MAMNHRISPETFGRYHGAVKTKELYSQQQHEHAKTRAGSGEGGRGSEPKVYDGFDKNFKPPDNDNRPHQLRDETRESNHRHGEIGRRGHDRKFDGFDLVSRDWHHKKAGHPSFGKIGNNPPIHGVSYQVTKITIMGSSIFSGMHLENPKEIKEAHQNLLNAALGFIKNPSDQAYKSLNDVMIKLMDPRFVPAITGGAAKMSIRDVNGATMIRFTMEVTPAPTKSLEEAREDLKNAYSSKRNGEKDIADIRAEAYANYIRALSEKFKKNGTISHTNHTPTTPVFKSQVLYVAKVTQFNIQSFHEIRKPSFEHHLHGRLDFKNQHNFWGGYRQNHKSYVDMLKHNQGKSHIDNNSHTRKAIEAKHNHHHSHDGKTEKAGHKHHGGGHMAKGKSGGVKKSA